MQVRVGGVWMSEVAPWGDVAYSHDEHGCKDATFRAYFPPARRHSAVVRGALVEILRGPAVVWAGFLDEPNWTTGTFAAKGYSYGAVDFLALDSTGAPTGNPETAIDEAADRGWAVNGHEISGGIFAIGGDEDNTVAALLDSVADEEGQRWSVRADRVVRMEADATEPDYVLGPGIAEFGNASDDYASALKVTYIDSGGLTQHTLYSNAASEKAGEKFGAKEVPLDLTELGAMDLARAQGYADGVLTKGAARLGWTSTVEVTKYDLLTVGGMPANLALVRDGQVVRIYGTRDDYVYLDGRTYLDVVIGSTAYAGGDVLTIGPVGSVAQTLSEVISELTERREAA